MYFSVDVKLLIKFCIGYKKVANVKTQYPELYF